MRLLIVISALLLASCGPEPATAPTDPQSPPADAPPSPPTPPPAPAPSPVEVVEAFYVEAGSAGPASVRDDFMAADVLEAWAARPSGRPVHDFRFNLTLPEEARADVLAGSRRFAREGSSEIAPRVVVTGDGIGNRLVFTLCRREDGWRIAEVEEPGHWTLRGDLGLPETVAGDC